MINWTKAIHIKAIITLSLENSTILINVGHKPLYPENFMEYLKGAKLLGIELAIVSSELPSFPRNLVYNLDKD